MVLKVLKAANIPDTMSLICPTEVRGVNSDALLIARLVQQKNSLVPSGVFTMPVRLCMKIPSAKLETFKLASPEKSTGITHPLRTIQPDF